MAPDTQPFRRKTADSATPHAIAVASWKTFSKENQRAFDGPCHRQRTHHIPNPRESLLALVKTRAATGENKHKLSGFTPVKRCLREQTDRKLRLAQCEAKPRPCKSPNKTASRSGRSVGWDRFKQTSSFATNTTSARSGASIGAGAA